jgi:hypothetical protein
VFGGVWRWLEKFGLVASRTADFRVHQRRGGVCYVSRRGVFGGGWRGLEKFGLVASRTANFRVHQRRGGVSYVSRRGVFGGGWRCFDLSRVALLPCESRCRSRPDSLKSSSATPIPAPSPFRSNSIDLKCIISAKSNIDGSCLRKSLKSKSFAIPGLSLGHLLPYGKTGGAAVAL